MLRNSDPHRATRPSHAPTAFLLKALPAAVALCCCTLVWAADINGAAGLPINGTVQAGSATGAVSGNQLSITQTSSRAVIDWSSFNIGAGKTVAFVQPGATSAVLNRVPASAGLSEIYGTMTANGMVLLMNPNGVLFGNSAQINVGSLIATTGTVSQAGFMAGGAIAITGAKTGSVTNQGAISAQAAGLIALVAPSVSNQGSITATGGRIALSGADRATVSLNGGLYEFAVDAGAMGTNASISNTAAARLDGATILMSTGDAANLLSGTINLEGVQQASSAIIVNGNVVMLNSALQAPGVSGSSNQVNVANSARIQNGIDIAATGGRVNVAAGTYAEQLAISRSLTLSGAGRDLTTITPTSLTADALGMRSILTIGGNALTNVDVNGFNFKGPVPEINAGIIVRDNAFAAIHDNRVTDIRESAALSGNQRGIGIWVGRALFNTSGRATIQNNVIAGYQKGGIVIDGAGSQASIVGNTVTGEGPTAVTAQNGIQISRGANASVSGNTVSGNSYTGASAAATGVLIYTPDYANLDASQGQVIIGPNTITANQIGINTNDPRTLSGMSLTGVSGNTSNAVADYQAWAASSATWVNVLALTGATNGDIKDVGGALGVSGWSGFTAIQPAIDAVATGGTVNMAGGTYVQSAMLVVNKALTLSGTGQAATIIDARLVSVFGISVTADNVSLKDFTLYGPSANTSSAYGIKVAPSGSGSARLRNFSVSNVTSRGAGRAELDLNGVDGALIDRVTADGAPVGNDQGTTAGAGIQITDSANVTIRNSTTRNNAWGGLALFQTNRAFDQQTNNISVEGNNHFTELNPVYLQDESASRDFGVLKITGFDYAVRNSNALNGSDQYTWLQATPQRAYDFAVNVPGAASSYIQGWNGSLTTQDYYVGTGNLTAGGQQSMSIATALDRASRGAGIHVAAGNYAENLVLDNPYQLYFSDTTLHSLTLNAGAAGTGIAGTVTADAPAGFAFNSSVNLLGDTKLVTNGANIDLRGGIQNKDRGSHSLVLRAGVGSGHGDVSGSITSLDSVDIASGGKISGNVTGSDVALAAQGDLDVVVTASHSAKLVGDSVVATVAAPVVSVGAVRHAQIAGSSPAITVDAPSGQVSGNFGKVTNTGDGLVSVNGKPQGNQVLEDNSESNRVTQTRNPRLGHSEPYEWAAIEVARSGGSASRGRTPSRVSAPAVAGGYIDRGQSVELDLSPSNAPKKM